MQAYLTNVGVSELNAQNKTGRNPEAPPCKSVGRFCYVLMIMNEKPQESRFRVAFYGEATSQESTKSGILRYLKKTHRQPTFCSQVLPNLFGGTVQRRTSLAAPASGENVFVHLVSSKLFRRGVAVPRPKPTCCGDFPTLPLCSADSCSWACLESFARCNPFRAQA